ncbi:DUF3095 domain-containing protein [Pararhizobium antarcticum]|uniref:Adenylate cyclase n=1 Tax=Pararhizobium antarcticum TaxID=1798805 RepID=A0A657LPD5_9HYPH|nr:DUF3095 domain-containing protein [Pararhizobium antarcticum]OJF92358.1 adenylate cyclase [Pararhizobium antarcticum]OJF94762.1 adenylate cyclase [Rhizobium sp. 58]
MAEISSDTFFSTLPVFVEFEGVADGGNYQPLPDNWALATADIVDSTGAIEAGNYKSVNMAGASVISAILNALGQHDLPFVFGGDGALVAIPPSARGKAQEALAAVQSWVAEELQMTMRAALVTVSDIRAAGVDVRVARFQVSEGVSYAMFAGGGASWAEARMKEGLYAVAPAAPGTRPDLSGLSCRWNPIKSRHGEIVSIIAVPSTAGSGLAFQNLITEVVTLAASGERDGHPVAAEGPQLGLSRTGLDTEARAAAPKGRRLRQKIFIIAQYILTVTLFRFGMTLGRFDPKVYRSDVAQNTDFRKFDDGLKMTIDVSEIQLKRIAARLEEAAVAGICRYGLHRQDSALMTCIVPTPLSRTHMHFIDGASGGYAVAASHLKGRPAALPNASAASA